MNLSSHVPTSSSYAESLIASKSLGILTATVKLVSRMRRNPKSDAASSSQPRLEDAYLGGLMDTAMEKLVATKDESGMWTFPILKPGDFKKRQSWRDPMLVKRLGKNPMYPVNQTIREVEKLKGYNGTVNETPRKDQKLERKNGHTTYTCLQPHFTIRKQSFRSSGESTDENMTTLSMIWT